MDGILLKMPLIQFIEENENKTAFCFRVKDIFSVQKIAEFKYASIGNLSSLANCYEWKAFRKPVTLRLLSIT